MKVKEIVRLDFVKFFYYNYFCKQVIRSKKCYILPYRGTIIELHRGATINLNSNLRINTGKVKGSRKEAYIQLYENAVLNINGNVSLAYEAMIQGHHDSIITLGDAYINTRATIIADKNITIGKDVLISRDVTIFDSDFHPVFDDNGLRTNEPSPVMLEDHTWIGVKATILRGVHVYSGAVIGANALVTADVKANTMNSSIPARAFGYIKWES